MIEKPKILKETDLLVLVFVDIGGYLFPDNPNLQSKPIDEIVRLTAAMCHTWGSEGIFIAANSNSGKSYGTDKQNISKMDYITKDKILLEANDIYRITGLIKDDFHFCVCDGAEDKGNQLKKLAVHFSKNYTNILPIICDNRILAARHAPKDAHCFLYNAKDVNDIGLHEWRKNPTTNLYFSENADEIFSNIFEIYINRISNLIVTKEEEIPVNVIEKEKDRVISIFNNFGFKF